MKQLRSAWRILPSFWNKIPMFHLSETVYRTSSLCALLHALISFIGHPLMNTRNEANLPEQFRFSPAGPRRPAALWVLLSRWLSVASRLFEWAIAHPVVRDYPWYHIDQLCTRAASRSRTDTRRAFAAATSRTTPRGGRLTAPGPQVTQLFDRVWFSASPHCAANCFD